MGAQVGSSQLHAHASGTSDRTSTYMAMRLVAIASTLGVSVATSPSVDASLIQVQREVLREGQSSGYEGSSGGSSTPLYVFVKFGTCDDYGYEFITTKAECLAAETQLGVVHKPLTADGNRQRYCGTWHHNTWLHFNPQASGTLNGHAILQRADGFTWQVCRKSDYAFVKSGTCEENGYHFIETKAECEAAGTSLGVVHKPLNADGNRQRYCGTWHYNTWLHFNPQASGILNGHAILQRADGFTWQVCKKSDYAFVKFGTCEENGYHFIKTKAECEAAGTSLGVVHKPLNADGNRQKYCGTWDHNTWLHS